MLDVQDLTKTYGAVRANDHITLSVAAGEVFGLLGPNGAGKTTLVRQVVGLAAPSSGRITLDGHDVVADPAAARRSCAVQPQGQILLQGMVPRRAIELAGRLRGGSKADVRRRSTELVDRLDLGAWADKSSLEQSGGVQRLVMFCMATVSPCRLLILDEPTNDVDPVRRRVLWEVIAEMAAEGTAVLVVTHNVHEAERSVDRLAVIDAGRVAATGTVGALVGAAGRGATLEDVYLEAVSATEAPDAA